MAAFVGAFALFATPAEAGGRRYYKNYYNGDCYRGGGYVAGAIVVATVYNRGYNATMGILSPGALLSTRILLPATGLSDRLLLWRRRLLPLSRTTIPWEG